MHEAYIVGSSMTRFGPFVDESVKSLTASAVGDVLADAESAPEAVQVAFFSNETQAPVEGQVSTPGQFALQGAGLNGLPIVNVENACASGATALWSASMCVRAGEADVALAVGTEKMVFADDARRRRVLDAFEGGLDIDDGDAHLAALLALGAGSAGESGSGHRTRMMDLYAALCRAHMARFGTTRDQLAVVASKNHDHASLNDKCHYNNKMSPQQVLAGRPLAYPLTVPMCSPLSDGSSAALVVNRDGLNRLPKAVQARAVRIRAIEMRSAVPRQWDDFDQHVIRRAGIAAYDRAGITPDDVDVAEVHDAAAFGEIFASELLGFTEMGGGGTLAESGETRIGGAIPVNPSGGLESRGHPIGATGLAQIFELVTQLRGEAGDRQVRGAEVAVQENGGAFLGVEEAVAVVSVLSPNS